jgi:hypothetical protein
MTRNQQLALEMLNEIDSARSGGQPLEQLEERLWRLLDATDAAFPPTVASRVEDLVQELRRNRRENLAFARPDEADEDRGAEALYNEVTGELHRFLG